MNFKYINRKQILGISHAADFVDWALLLVNEAENNGISLNSKNIYSIANNGLQLWESASPAQMQRIVELFNSAIYDLEFEFHHEEAENTALTKSVQTINSEARRLELVFNMIDLRQISELGKELSDSELLDSLAVECGFRPLGKDWKQYPYDSGRRKLQALFDNEVNPNFPATSNFTVSNALAKQFLTCFEECVRYYGNDASENLQSRHDVDNVLVLCDNKHIGLLLHAQDYI